MNLMTPKLLRELQKLIAEDNIIKFYKWKEYIVIRTAAKKRDNNECQLCKAQGKHSTYGACHHIQEVKDYPELALSLKNVQIVCKMHHNQLHPEKFNNIKPFTNEEWF